MKAQGMSMSLLVVAALAVMVLLLAGVFFTGGFRATGSNMVDFIQGSTGDAASAASETVCLSWCSKENLDEDKNYPRPDGYCHSDIPTDDCTTKFDCKPYCAASTPTP